MRKLKRWGMKKNITSRQWNHAGSLIQERKMRGKETALIINDKAITERRLKKELRRHASHQYEVNHMLGKLFLCFMYVNISD